jgi:hypothetical protein
MTSISQKRLEKLKKRGKLRDRAELWIDKHNHKMEFIRTISSLIGLCMSTVIMLKVFGWL